MRMSIRGAAELAGHEGIVLAPYLDSVGVWTWGIGHTAAAGSPDPATMPRAVEQPLSAALETFVRDLAKYEDEVNDAVRVSLQQHEFDALVSFHYNTGGIRRAQLTRALNDGDMAGARDGFMGWLRPPEIRDRREREQNLFARGIYSRNGMATVYPADANGRVKWLAGRNVSALDLLADINRASHRPPVEPDIPDAPDHFVDINKMVQPTTQPAPEAGFFMRLIRRIFR